MNIEVSVGEVVDKITILQIKLGKIKDPVKLANVERECTLLENLLNDLFERIPADIALQIWRRQGALYSVNIRLWEIEDLLRAKEAREEFDEEFIKLARSVYQLNDLRASIKKQINIDSNSEIVEEKLYTEYQ